jgi:hypothetical protein
MITPNSIRRMVTVFSFRLDISLYQLRYKVQGTGCRGYSKNLGVRSQGSVLNGKSLSSI